MSTTELPRRWFTAGTNLQVWGSAGTYKAIPVELLPPLPNTKLDGSFAWLRAEPESPHGLDFGDDDGGDEKESIHVRLARIVDEAKKLRLVVPGELVRFIDDEGLHGRVSSCTSCYLDVPTKLVPLPDGQPGRLLRFMNDQQCCLLWYVHLQPDGGHQVVCAYPEFADDLTGDSLEDVSRPKDLVVCAPSFEEFIQRFWIENTLWFTCNKGAPLSPDLQAYADAAKAGRDSI